MVLTASPARGFRWTRLSPSVIDEDSIPGRRGLQPERCACCLETPASD
jgi:hypothetical protein